MVAKELERGWRLCCLRTKMAVAEVGGGRGHRTRTWVLGDGSVLAWTGEWRCCLLKRPLQGTHGWEGHGELCFRDVEFGSSPVYR